MGKYVILNDDQENDFTMFLAVKAFIQLIMQIVVTVQAFVVANTLFNTQVENISTNSRSRESLRKGVALTKADLKVQLSAAISKLAGLLFNYGFTNNKPQICAVCKELTESALVNMRDTETGEKAVVVLDLAEAEILGLTDYRVTAERLADTRALATEYTSSVGKTSSSLARGAATTKVIKQCFKDAKATLVLMDNFMDDLKTEHPQEWEQWQEVRKVHRIGVRHEEEEPAAPPSNPT